MDDEHEPRRESRCQVIGCGVPLGGPRDGERYCDRCQQEIDAIEREERERTVE
jgi:uncharacterized Zn finger protein (UPF0148 family)